MYEENGYKKLQNFDFKFDKMDRGDWMRCKKIVLSVLLGIVIPVVMFLAMEQMFLQSDGKTVAVDQYQEETLFIPSTNKAESCISVLLLDGTVEEMELDSYVLGVVLAEMPADFEMDALKAQAIAARTYALKTISNGKKHDHNAVCTESNCCQAFCSTQEYLLSLGDEDDVRKIQKAVQETTGMVLKFEDILIDSTYFSCSGGRTEDAKAVWGQNVEYLQSVESPGEEGTKYYIETVSFPLQDFMKRIGVPLEEASNMSVGSIRYTSGGGVDVVQIGDRVFTGLELRQLLGLRSTAMVISLVGETVTITTKGFGHRVGMSQYGAEAMAVEGYDYQQILAYYYPGTTLERLPE